MSSLNNSWDSLKSNFRFEALKKWNITCWFSLQQTELVSRIEEGPSEYENPCEPVYSNVPTFSSRRPVSAQDRASASQLVSRVTTRNMELSSDGNEKRLIWFSVFLQDPSLYESEVVYSSLTIKPRNPNRTKSRAAPDTRLVQIQFHVGCNRRSDQLHFVKDPKHDQLQTLWEIDRKSVV